MGPSWTVVASRVWWSCACWGESTSATSHALELSAHAPLPHDLERELCFESNQQCHQLILRRAQHHLSNQAPTQAFACLVDRPYADDAGPHRVLCAAAIAIAIAGGFRPATYTCS